MPSLRNTTVYSVCAENIPLYVVVYVVLYIVNKIHRKIFVSVKFFVLVLPIDKILREKLQRMILSVLRLIYSILE